jgi:hypothetical protein
VGEFGWPPGNGKREKVTIGSYPAFTIKQARDRHEELRALVERGESPAKSKQAAVVERKLADERRVTFRVFSQRWIEETLFYRSAGYVAQFVRWLDAYVNSAIGDMPIGDVQPGDVLAIIKGRVHKPGTAERTSGAGSGMGSDRQAAPKRPRRRRRSTACMTSRTRITCTRPPGSST